MLNNKITKYILIFTLIVGLGVLIIIYIRPKANISQKENGALINLAITSSPSQRDNIKASFIVFTNGTKRIFSDSKYHNRSETVFITADNPAIIHSNPGITYKDFFATLPMEVTTECLIAGTGQTFCNNANATLKFFINGQLTPDLLETTIQNNDKVLISYGSDTEKTIQSQLSQVPDP